MTTANLTREETAARSAAVTARSIRVELDLTGAPDQDQATFPVRTTLEFDATTTTTWIDFIGERVARVVVNGIEQAVAYDGARIVVDGLAAQNTVEIEASGLYSRSGEGLHRFVDPVDGETYLYTHYEPADARRVMACFEQPDMKSRYTFVVTAPEGWHVLSNQSPAHTALAAGTQIVEFAPTLPLSSYITCIAAGPYHRVQDTWTGEAGEIALGVFCRASLAPHLDADEILTVTKQGLDFFHEAFAFPYPWGKYDQIFVPEYNIGAMENPGLVTFTEAYIFRGASTRAQKSGRANTILHEMAHMWFGDLVTMRWWDDLWLKESFADYMGSHASAAATEYTDAWVAFANRRKAWAYTQDQLPTTHPIVADITDLEAAKLNFDGITYAKGASVLKQLVAFVGEDAFFEGARRYFVKHAYGNTTLDDLLIELEQASGRDLRDWSKAWLETSGMSTLSLAQDASGATVLHQTEPRPHRVQVGLYDLVDGTLTLRERIGLDILDESTPLDTGDADLVLINDADLTYAKARLDDRSLDTVDEALSTLDDELARGLVWSALWNATRDGELPVIQYLSIVGAHAQHETNVGVLAGLLANASFAARAYLPEALSPQALAAWLDTTWNGLHGAAPGSGAQLVWARAMAEAAEVSPGRADEIRALLSGTAAAPEGLTLDADLRWLLLTALAATGDTTEADVVRELESDDTASGRTAALHARAAVPTAAVRDAAWSSAWNDLTLSNDHLDATISGFRAGGRRDLIAKFDEDYFARIIPAWQARSIEIARRLVVGLFPATPTLTLVDAWLAEHPDAPAALRRLVIEQRDHRERALRVQGAL
ncbi:aminopeptidase N [Microbacterium keratanolyticum]|uniref:Aminopeptidase N n=1 Tax=Microbacterium keratanolyticum TaxID=67574 RepID=A0A9W6HV02_9MICO|nr:aminopeptidase N [Microbacterium keratanolyticum]MBM7467682.1 aminopeptidase N [Microbacterium keratanolyticum]GLK02674.1 aminopeptidase [Microbacterium keratanolyticum]